MEFRWYMYHLVQDKLCIRLFTATDVYAKSMFRNIVHKINALQIEVVLKK